MKHILSIITHRFSITTRKLYITDCIVSITTPKRASVDLNLFKMTYNLRITNSNLTFAILAINTGKVTLEIKINSLYFRAHIFFNLSSLLRVKHGCE